jgi:Bacterial TniB protein
MNGEHLSPKTRELLNRPVEERVAYIQKDSWIPYSHANRILQQLEDLLNHPECDRMPNLPRPRLRAFDEDSDNATKRGRPNTYNLYWPVAVRC